MCAPITVFPLEGQHPLLKGKEARGSAHCDLDAPFRCHDDPAFAVRATPALAVIVAVVAEVALVVTETVESTCTAGLSKLQLMVAYVMGPSTAS